MKKVYFLIMAMSALSANASHVKTAADIQAVAFCISQTGTIHRGAPCAGVKSNDEALAVSFCISQVGTPNAIVCKGIKTHEDVNAITSCINQVGSSNAAACGE